MTKKPDRVWIPKVPKTMLKELGARIKPVIRFVAADNELNRTWGQDGDTYWIEPCDLFNEAYTWDPRPGRRAEGLVPLTEITTYHSWAYYGFFKPSIAEVLAQIPADHRDRVVAFEIIKHPECAADINAESEALNAGYHVATTRLYVEQYK